MRHAEEQRHVCADAEGEVEVCQLCQLDKTRVGDDQLRAASERFLHPRCRDGMRFRHVGADAEVDIRLL